MNKIFKNQVCYSIYINIKIYILYIYLKYFFILESDKNIKTNSWQENRCRTCSNMSIDELKRAFDAERKDYEKKIEKIMKTQLDPLRLEKRSNDLEITVSKLRAERDEYLYEINCLKKQHKTEVIYEIVYNNFNKVKFINIFVSRS